MQLWLEELEVVIARDPAHIRNIILRLETVWTKYPDLRLGQLIMNIHHDPYYVEDEYFIELIEAYYGPGVTRRYTPQTH